MELHDEHVVDWCYDTTGKFIYDYTVGEAAYVNGIPFSTERSDAWQLGWLDAKDEEQAREFDQECPETD